MGRIQTSQRGGAIADPRGAGSSRKEMHFKSPILSQQQQHESTCTCREYIAKQTHHMDMLPAIGSAAAAHAASPHRHALPNPFQQAHASGSPPPPQPSGAGMAARMGWLPSPTGAERRPGEATPERPPRAPHARRSPRMAAPAAQRACRRGTGRRRPGSRRRTRGCLHACEAMVTSVAMRGNEGHTGRVGCRQCWPCSVPSPDDSSSRPG